MVAQALFIRLAVAAAAAAGLWLPLAHCFQPSPLAQFQTSSRPSSPRFMSFLSVSTVPRIQSNHIQELASKGFVVIPDFLPQELLQSLRDDVSLLRNHNKFRVAGVGQDATNTLDTEIRVAETCFLGPAKLQDLPSDARSQLYETLAQVRQDLSGNSVLQSPHLDAKLDELLYAYYPKGGFYRRHRDAIPNSASVLRSYSLLLYLNKDWTPQDGGQLRLHRDSGGDVLPPGEAANYLDVEPRGGTLVLFQSDRIPHEVLDTNAERMAVVGWYNRNVSPTDIATLASDEDKTRTLLLATSAALVTLGVVMAF